MFSTLHHRLLLAIATACLIVVLAAGLIWQLAIRDAKPGQAEQAFYMEYTIERNGPSLQDHDLLPTVVAGRWWYAAPDKFRYEWTSTDPLLGKTESVNANNGSVGTQYDGTTNTFRATPIAPAGPHPMGSGPISPTWASLPIGPLAFASVDEAMERLARGSTVTHRGGETILGHQAEVYVVERTAPALPDGLPARIRETYWIEDEPLAILKGVAESSDGGQVTITATRLEYRRSIDNESFRLKQPAGSQDVSATPQATSSAMGESTVPEPFLKATYLPDGFRWVSSSGSPAISHTQTFRSMAGGDLRIDQRYRHGGWPQDVPMPGIQNLYAAGDVWVVHKDSPIVLIALHGDIIVRIEAADGVTYEQAVGVLFALR